MCKGLTKGSEMCKHQGGTVGSRDLRKRGQGDQGHLHVRKKENEGVVVEVPVTLGRSEIWHYSLYTKMPYFPIPLRKPFSPHNWLLRSHSSDLTLCTVPAGVSEAEPSILNLKKASLSNQNRGPAEWDLIRGPAPPGGGSAAYVHRDERQ